MYKHFYFNIIFLTLFLSAQISLSKTSSETKEYYQLSPEIESEATKLKSKKKFGKEIVVVSANNYATSIAKDILIKGGSAADAAVIIQLVLGLVEPQSSGIGGGSFALYYEKDKKKIINFEGREKAPKKIKSNIFLDEDGTPKKFFDAVLGGESVGVPATLEVLYQIHKKYGKIEWEKLFNPVIELAEKGFYPPPRLLRSLDKEDHLWKINQDNSYFQRIINNPEVKVQNKDYAKTLRLISRNYRDFYEGKIAQNIVKKVQNSNINPGKLDIQDMESYQVTSSKALCKELKQIFICGPNLPSSGGILLAQALVIFENYNFLKTHKKKQRLLDIMAFIYNERSSYLADSEFENINVDGLLNKEYLIKKFDLFLKKELVNLNNSRNNFNSTSHFTVLDKYGNVISMTSSIENAFGSRLFVDGFLLNNQLTDFSFKTKNSKGFIKNRPEGGKKPLSSMSPIIILDKKKNFILSIGSPGGTAIIAYVLKNIIDIIYYDLDPLKSVESGNYLKKDKNIFIEKKLLNKDQFIELNDEESKIIETPLTSGLGIIVKKKNGYIGVADVRRDGTVYAK